MGDTSDQCTSGKIKATLNNPSTDNPAHPHMDTKPNCKKDAE